MLPLTSDQLTNLWTRRNEIGELLENPKTTQEEEMELYVELRDINGKLFTDHQNATKVRSRLEAFVFGIILIMGTIMIGLAMSSANF